jgi:hypothetical protein
MSDVLRCPSCGDELRPGTASCPDCGVPLSAGDAPPPAEPAAETDAASEGEPVGGDEPASEPATLDLHPLSDPQRRLVDQLLTARRVRHSWQGGDLLVPAHLAGEAELAVEQALAAGADAVGRDGPTVVYEVAAWPVAVHARLAELLGETGIAHQWDPNGDLVVAEADEEAVEALFDRIDEAELVDAPDPLPILDALHGHLARLGREPHDLKARQGLTEAAADLRAATMPFGFDPPVWRALVAATTTLADSVGTLDGARLRDRATALRQELLSWL